jgi:hypothetical protein
VNIEITDRLFVSTSRTIRSQGTRASSLGNGAQPHFPPVGLRDPRRFATSAEAKTGIHQLVNRTPVGRWPHRTGKPRGSTSNPHPAQLIVRDDKVVIPELGSTAGADSVVLRWAG